MGGVIWAFADQSSMEKEYPHLLAVSTDRGKHWQLASTGVSEMNIAGSKE
jgi:hypothetical protein